MGNTDQLRRRLDALTGGAPQRSTNVRTLAKFAANSQCALATLGFAARVDFDRVLAKTRYEVPFGQSPFAFRRGNQFEERLRQGGHAPIFALLRETLGYDVSAARAVSLRKGYERGEPGLQTRVEVTRRLIESIVARRDDAPNLIDGAVFTRVVGGQPAYFEADAVAAHFEGPIYAGEIKSFPTVDGQADPDKVGAAIAQASIYILLLRDVVAQVGGDPSIVSDKALLITPRNTGLQPTMTAKSVGREIERQERILAQAPDALSIVESLSADVPSFADVANKERVEEERIEAAHCLAEKVGTRFGPSCLGSCGMSRLCRERAHAAGDPARVGPQLVRLLPNVRSLDRVAQLAANDAPRPGEEAVAEQLARAERLRERLARPPAPIVAAKPARVAS